VNIFSSLCSFLHPPVTAFLLYPYAPFFTFFSKNAYTGYRQGYWLWFFGGGGGVVFGFKHSLDRSLQPAVHGVRHTGRVV